MDAITREQFNQLYKSHIEYMTGDFDQYDMTQHGNFSGLLIKNFNLNGLNISNANFRNTVFENCTMVCGTFKDCCFDGCTFNHVKADWAIFDNSTFRHTTFMCPTYDMNQFIGVSFDNCYFEGAIIRHIDLSNSNFRGSEIIGSLFQCVTLTDCVFDEVIFDHSARNMLNHTKFIVCTMPGASLNGVENMTYVEFESCVFDNNSTKFFSTEGIKILDRKLYRKIIRKRFFDSIFNGKRKNKNVKELPKIEIKKEDIS